MGIIYFGTSKTARKIGETTRQICQRTAEIRKTEPTFKPLAYIKYEGDKVTNLMIEGILRYELVKLGYKHFGNDHFKINEISQKQFVKDCISITTKILNDYEIQDYKVKTCK